MFSKKSLAFTVLLAFATSLVVTKETAYAGWTCTTDRFFVDLWDAKLLPGNLLLFMGFVAVSITLLIMTVNQAQAIKGKPALVKLPRPLAWLTLGLAPVTAIAGYSLNYRYIFQDLTWYKSTVICTDVLSEVSSKSVDTYTTLLSALGIILFLQITTLLITKYVLTPR